MPSGSGMSASRRESSSTASIPQSVQQATAVAKQEVKLVNVPPRTPDSSKRTTPSPLSKPVTMSPEPKVDTAPSPPPVEESEPAPATPVARPSSPAKVAVADSPAARQLAALGKKDEKKKSKLRRAFSFGSASELRKATAQANIEKENAVKASRRTSKYEDELEPEQAAIAERQEAAGLGESIYSRQGFYTGSTDNLSISSTASSASIMLRKMGKGVKKSTKSLVGLFRPKSVIGVPAADGPVVQPSVAQVSMVTVEAEREKVNVNADPHDQAGGGTGFPKLQRNSLDAAANTSISSGASEVRSRRSIVGGEKERAEVLAAVKKGILKRTDSGQGSPSPVTTPYSFKVPDFNLPQIPHVNDSPISSAPSTPGEDHPPRSGHRRTDSVAIEGLESEDYFSSITRFASMEAKNTPNTPRGTNRNISFSPRIQFHDTWTSSDYDRRGDIATCNRLTPMLAQQIKEELNTFKMEMEVHESSKVYTHFF
ncbi:putative protein bni4 [Phaeomoniella chlamydospora]|uniref:Protein BNI4 n=1 Tax=Phaeomoniella chlamydospora TaxID=158046 RepID=A0A0G2E3V8_PHACM|nr:putative protein bni4 [Phaeomoniella chlamydospora]